MDNTIVELTEKIVWLEKMYNQTISSLDGSINNFLTGFIGFLGFSLLGLIFITKQTITSGVEKGIREMRKEYDEKFKEQQKKIDSMAIESGRNANGSYLRLPDGTQICYMRVMIPYNNDGTLSKMAIYPANFNGEDSDIVINANLIGDTIINPEDVKVIYESIGTQWISVTIVNPNKTFIKGDNAEVSITVIGKWK